MRIVRELSGNKLGEVQFLWSKSLAPKSTEFCHLQPFAICSQCCHIHLYSVTVLGLVLSRTAAG